MTVETPDHFGGKPIPEDAIEIALAAEKKKKEGNEGKAPSLGSFIYVPSVNLYVAKERSHLGKEWHNAHKELHKQNLRMPTIPQFIEFLKCLRADPTAENTRVYKEITEARDPSRAEWLDAKFYLKDDELWVAYNHIIDSDGNVVPQDHKKLEGHLMQDTPGISLEHWLNSPPKQGLPPADARQGDLSYRHPRDGDVALFIANSAGGILNCNVNPGYSGSNLGVFACFKGTRTDS